MLHSFMERVSTDPEESAQATLQGTTRSAQRAAWVPERFRNPLDVTPHRMALLGAWQLSPGRSSRHPKFGH